MPLINNWLPNWILWPNQTNFFLELFNGSELERKVIERAGCLNYSYSPWELDKADVYQRQTYYKFDKRISRYRGEVTSTQQRSPLSNKNGWLIEEVMTLHGIPLGDYFTVCTPTLLCVIIHLCFYIAWEFFCNLPFAWLKCVPIQLNDILFQFAASPEIPSRRYTLKIHRM